MITHHSVITSSLRIKNLKIDKFGDFSSDIDDNNKTDVLRDVIYFIINQYEHRRPKDASRAAQSSEARLLNMKVENFTAIVIEIQLKLIERPSISMIQRQSSRVVSGRTPVVR